MSNYSYDNKFANKNTLPRGDANKAVNADEFETEFSNIQTAVNSKADALNGTITNPTLAGTVTFTGATITDFEGNVVGNVTGDLTGDVTGNVTGNVIGNVTGNLTGDVTGDLTGNVTGNVTGNLTGTLLTAFQPNITFVGTLSSLDVSGDLAVNTDTLFVDSSSGYVGIDAAPPAAKLHVRHNASSVAHIFAASSASNVNTRLALATVGAADTQIVYNKDLAFGFSASPSDMLTSVTEHMRIDASGLVDIKREGNQSEPALIFGGDGDTGIFKPLSNTLAFTTFGNERMRIDSSGNLLVGQTAATPGIGHILTGSQPSAVYRTTSGVADGVFYIYSNVTSTQKAHLIVYADGDVRNTNNSYGALSDERLKSDITDASPQLDDIMAVKVRSYTLNDTGAKHIGVIAQELEEAGMDGLVKTDEDGIKSVKYSVLYMKAIKAIQEQQAIIEELRARVAQLESGV